MADVSGPASAGAPDFSLAARQEAGGSVVVATVRNVVSADTIAVIKAGPPSRGPPEEHLVSFASVRAPLLGRIDYKEKIAKPDEPYAWEAREFVRKALIGKKIQYIVEFTSPKNNREYCTVYADGEHFGIKLAASGLVNVIPPAGKRDPRPDQAEMMRLAEVAKQEGRGAHNQATRLTAERELSVQFDSFKFFEANKGKDFDAVVDQVRNGSTIRVFAIDAKKAHHMTLLTVRFAGVQAPIPSFQEGTEDPPFSREAKFVLESVILGREVKVRVECLDKQDGVVFGRVLVDGKDPAELVLQLGLAKFVQWNCPHSLAAKYTQLQENAQKTKVRLWSLASNQNEIANKAKGAHSSGKQGEITGRVREVQNNGAIVILEGWEGEGTPTEHVVTLSSIVLPRLGGPNGKDEPWAWEAKDLLRNRLVGKTVKAVLDYVRPANDNYPEKPFYSVFVGKTNVALFLIERGLAKLIKHRENDPRSSSYAALLNSEQLAIKKNKGIHGPADKAPVHHITDLSRNSNIKKAQQFLPFLKKDDRVSAVVEYVFGGDRVKLYCPKATCMINFNLTGVKCPRSGRDKSDPHGDEVTAFARLHLHQHDVQVEVETVDKGGSFLGRLLTADGKTDWAMTLLDEGMASVHVGSANRMQQGNQYITAEAKAKAKKLRIWEKWDPEAEKAKAEEEKVVEDDKKEWLQLQVTEVLDGGSFCAQVASSLHKLEALKEEINAAPPPHDSTFRPKPKENVLANFDGEWHRARVLSEFDGDFEVLFLDYGNADVLPLKELRRIDARFLTLEPQAKEYHLAYVQPPSLNDEFGTDAAMFLKDNIWDKTLSASIEYKEGDKTYVNLGDPKGGLLVNALLVGEGLARVKASYRQRGKPVVSRLVQAEEQARKGHLKMWQYGDLPDDDLDEPEVLRKR